MKITSIRCDFCSQEIYYQSAEKELNFHKPISIDDFTYGSETTHHTGKHFCSILCLSNYLESYISGKPLEEEILKSLAEKLNYNITKPAVKQDISNQPPNPNPNEKDETKK